MVQELKIDVRGFMSNDPTAWSLEIQKEKDYKHMIDEPGMKRVKHESEYYFDQTTDEHPLAGLTTLKEIERYSWPKVKDPYRMKGA